MRQLSFKRHRFPPEVIRHSIWLYARFTLSFRDAVATLAGSVNAINESDTVDRKLKRRLVGGQPVNMADGAKRGEHGCGVVAGRLIEMLLGKRYRIQNVFGGEACGPVNLQPECRKVVGRQFALRGEARQGVLLPGQSAGGPGE